MAIRRLQNKIANNRLSLLFTALYALAITLPTAIATGTIWVQLAIIAASTLLMVELNNAYALIREFSRMVSCSFLVLAIAHFQLIYSLEGSIVQICFIFFYLFLFRAYQNKRSPGWVFYAFMSLGIAGIFFPQIVFLVPLLWIILFSKVLAGSIKTLTASILGYLTPYWIIGGYLVYKDELSVGYDYIAQLTQFEPICIYNQIEFKAYLFFGFLMLLTLVGTIHFLRNSFLDKIKTRMIYEALMVINIGCIVFLILQPQHYSFLIRLIIVNTSPFIGHFITLTRTRLTNITFIVFTLSAVAVTLYTLWMP